MLVTCNNKGCLKASNALLNEETGEVICQECGQPITNVTGMMKRALKSFGQIIRAERKAFLQGCRSCKANREVVLNENNETICKVCHNPIQIHEAFKLAMEEAGKLEKIDTSADKSETKTKKKVTRKKATKK
jgi:hypothetical protein